MSDFFLIGEIKSVENFIDTVELLCKEEIEVRENIKLKRTGLNQFKLSYKNETVDIDLNLPDEKGYTPPYRLGYYKTYREHFAIVHAGEGDGWDINNPCMSSVVIHNGQIYLIDAGPNVKHVLNYLGISINEVKGIFHTHTHDDHFAGLTNLIQADHKIEYYATKPVRMSVEKKLNSLVKMDNVLETFFDVKEMKMDEYNHYDGMEVLPIFSPHPVETTMFYFRVISEFGHKTYYHMADTSRFEILENMITDNPKEPGISNEYFEKVKKDYLLKADVKKIDIGGAMIHGCAEDFYTDESDKKILSHTDRELSNEEKEIGERANFGQMDVLIPANNHSVYRFAKEYLSAYFPGVNEKEFRDILNCPIETFGPGNTILKSSGQNDFFYLSLTGTVEVIDVKKNIHQSLRAGSMIGEMSALLNKKREKTYVASSFISVLKIPAVLYRDFAQRNDLIEEIQIKRKLKGTLGNMWLFQEVASSPVINFISRNLTTIDVKEGDKITIPKDPCLCCVFKGELELKSKRGNQKIKELDFCLEDLVIEKSLPESTTLTVKKTGKICFVPLNLFENIPAVLWKIYEHYSRNKIIINKK